MTIIQNALMAYKAVMLDEVSGKFWSRISGIYQIAKCTLSVFTIQWNLFFIRANVSVCTIVLVKYFFLLGFKLS